MAKTSKEIIKYILEDLDIKAPTFANNINVEYGRIYDIVRDRTKNISSNLANAINKIYPQYCLFWLINGMGESHGNTLLDLANEYTAYKGVCIDEFTQMVNIKEYRLALMKPSEITKNELHRISLNYPDLNIDWLLTGQGSMLNSDAIIVGDDVVNQYAAIRKEYQIKYDALTNKYNELNEKYTSLLEENRELLKKEIEENKKTPDRDAPGATFADAK